MTRQSLCAFGFTVLFATCAAAATTADANGDGVLSIDEVQAAMPDITAEYFSMMDLNADGILQENEISAAEEAGLMPTSG